MVENKAIQVSGSLVGYIWLSPWFSGPHHKLFQIPLAWSDFAFTVTSLLHPGCDLEGVVQILGYLWGSILDHGLAVRGAVWGGG